jgi:transcriptional regulator with XRE-family HTH domain
MDELKGLDYYKIGQRIRKYRKACKMSQEQLAEKTGISVTHLSHIETGNTKLSLQVFVNIAEALCIQTDELLHDIAEQNISAKQEILDLFSLCDARDTYILKDVLIAVKTTLDKYA